MPPLTSLNTPVRISRNFIKQNISNLGAKAEKKLYVLTSIQKDIKSNTKTKDKRKSKHKPESAIVQTNKFVALSPNVFRKSTFGPEALRTEIKKPKIDMRRPSLRFDPAYKRSLPVYLDIPDLYTIKKTPAIPRDPFSRYKYVAKLEVTEVSETKARYVFIPRPKTPKNYLPRPKSGNRYLYVKSASKGERYKRGSKELVKSVFKPKERYVYKSRPSTPKNYKPRPKSGKRYTKRYSFPGPKKTVFKYIGRYQYMPRPPTPQNFIPRPKSCNRYICSAKLYKAKSHPTAANPYERKSIFKPQCKYVYKVKPGSGRISHSRPKSSCNPSVIKELASANKDSRGSVAFSEDTTGIDSVARPMSATQEENRNGNDGNLADEGKREVMAKQLIEEVAVNEGNQDIPIDEANEVNKDTVIVSKNEKEIKENTKKEEKQEQKTKEVSEEEQSKGIDDLDKQAKELSPKLVEEKENVQTEIQKTSAKVNAEEEKLETKKKLQEIEKEEELSRKKAKLAKEKAKEEESNKKKEDDKKTNEAEIKKDTNVVESSEKNKADSVQIGNWGDEEIRKRIHVTAKGWELRGTG